MGTCTVHIPSFSQLAEIGYRQTCLKTQTISLSLSIYIYIYIYTYIYIYIYIYIYLSLSTYIYIYIYTCILYIYIYTSLSLYIYIYIYMYNMYIYIYIYIYIHAHTYMPGGSRPLREMGGAPRNPAPRNHFWGVWIVKPLGWHCTDGHLTSRDFTSPFSEPWEDATPRDPSHPLRPTRTSGTAHGTPTATPRTR